MSLCSVFHCHQLLQTRPYLQISCSWSFITHIQIHPGLPYMFLFFLFGAILFLLETLSLLYPRNSNCRFLAFFLDSGSSTFWLHIFLPPFTFFFLFLLLRIILYTYFFSFSFFPVLWGGSLFFFHFISDHLEGREWQSMLISSSCIWSEPSNIQHYSHISVHYYLSQAGIVSSGNCSKMVRTNKTIICTKDALFVF